MSRKIRNNAAGRYTEMSDAQLEREQAAFRRAVERLQANELRELAARKRHTIQVIGNGTDKPVCGKCGRRIGHTPSGSGWSHL